MTTQAPESRPPSGLERSRLSPPPTVNEQNRHFWTGGAAGEIRFLRCAECNLFIHPPAPVCRRCRAMNPSPQKLNKTTGRVVSFTVNQHRWHPEDTSEYAVVIVELDDQEGLRLTTNIVDCEARNVYIGMPVDVAFERKGDAWLVLFRPQPASPPDEYTAP